MKKLHADGGDWRTVRFRADPFATEIRDQDGERQVDIIGQRLLCDVAWVIEGHLLVGTGQFDFQGYPLGEELPPAPHSGYGFGASLLLASPAFESPDGPETPFECTSSTVFWKKFYRAVARQYPDKDGDDKVAEVVITEARRREISDDRYTVDLIFTITDWVARPESFIEPGEARNAAAWKRWREWQAMEPVAPVAPRKGVGVITSGRALPPQAARNGNLGDALDNDIPFDMERR